MLSFLPGPVIIVIFFICFWVNTILIATPITVLGLLRLIPWAPLRQFAGALNHRLFRLWVQGNALTIRLTNRIKWTITGDELPPIAQSCVIIANHQSWADIIFIDDLYRGRIPTTKFFLKHSLIYLPFVGTACWALNMPFLRRYSRKDLLKNPALRNRDIATTRKACALLAAEPSALVNFVEGTRWTPDKAEAAKSPYRHLMPPRPGALAVAIHEMGPACTFLINTTLLYPHNEGHTFRDLITGKIREVRTHTEVIPITAELRGDYLNDKVFKHDFTMRMRALWKEKEARLMTLSGGKSGD